MNSTSAGERVGKVALVDDGKILVGAPGAPGCTMTGLAESACCVNALDGKKVAQTDNAIKVAWIARRWRLSQGGVTSALVEQAAKII